MSERETHFKIDWVAKDRYVVVMPCTDGLDATVFGPDSLSACCNWIATIEDDAQ